MDFDSLEKAELRKYVDFLMWHYKVVDAFWYIYLEEEQGSKTADHFNERVWHKAAALAARAIKKRFDIPEKGLSAFVQALHLFPWAIITGYDIEERPGEVVISVPDCPSQRARLERGLGEYECKEMHRGEFISFAGEIDPAIKVECVHAPPDPHPDERFCRWRFTMPQGSPGA